MKELREKLIEQVAEALKNATPNQIYLILETIQCITQGTPGD